MTLAERLARYSRKDQDSDCVLWTGARNPNGYGAMYLCRRTDGRGSHVAGAHRIAYELAHGPIPDGLTIDHLCRVKACVNPGHMEAVQQRVNVQRAAALKTTCPSGHAYDMLVARKSGTVRRCRECLRRQGREAWARALCRRLTRP